MVLKEKVRLLPWKELSKYANDKIVSKTEVCDMSNVYIIVYVITSTAKFLWAAQTKKRTACKQHSQKTF